MAQAAARRESLTLLATAALAGVAVVLTGLNGLAVWRGDWPERVVAAAMAAGVIATPLIELHPIARHPHLGLFVVDTALLVVVAGVALRSSRWWPLFCCAFVLLATAAGLALAFDERVAGLTGGAGPVFWNAMAALALGAASWELRPPRTHR